MREAFELHKFQNQYKDIATNREGQLQAVRSLFYLHMRSGSSG